MRMLRTYALAALVVALALGATLPARAGCTGAQIITTFTADAAKSWSWTDGWPVLYYEDYAPYAVDVKPFTPEATGLFWQFGAGDPATGTGVDVGLKVGHPTLSFADDWMVYYDWWSDLYQTQWWSAAGLNASWSNDADLVVDGCILPGVCECVLLQDQRDGIGYFAVIAGMTNSGGDLLLNRGGTDPAGTNALPYILKEIPAPDVVRADLDEATHLAQFEVMVTTPVDGVYNADGCNCGPVGYVVYEQAVPWGSAAPSDRDRAQGWTAVSGVTPMGAAATYTSSACTDDSQDGVALYLATGLVFNSGFPGNGPTTNPYKVILSKNNFDEALHCGANIAEPKPLQPRIRRERPDVPRPQRTR